MPISPSASAPPEGRPSSRSGPAAAVTVVVPTFNERDNIGRQIEHIAEGLRGSDWRVIVVDDDSPDGTAEAVKVIAARDPRVECLRRVGRRGLAGAVVEGMMASVTPLVAVIDADLQHDARLLPRMLEVLADPAVDLVVGSRYMAGGESGRAGLSDARRRGSRLATWLAARVLRAEVSDPVSGYFMVRREVVERVAPRLSRHGFKILFDIIASQRRPLLIVELPYSFAARAAGQSKLDAGVVADYLGLVVAKLSGGWIPQRALLFGLVGASGVAVHLATLTIGLRLGGSFAMAQTAAALLAMTSNFLINNAVTYRDRRLTGHALLIGYLRFCALCAVGLLVNVAVAEFAHQRAVAWWLAGLGGAACGAAWNYVTTSRAVW